MPKLHRRVMAVESNSEWQFTLERWSELAGPEWQALSWRARLAWRIRLFANRIDQKLCFAIVGTMPAHVTQDDLWDALAFGIAASSRYIDELDRERSVG